MGSPLAAFRDPKDPPWAVISLEELGRDSTALERPFPFPLRLFELRFSVALILALSCWISSSQHKISSWASRRNDKHNV